MRKSQVIKRTPVAALFTLLCVATTNDVLADDDTRSCLKAAAEGFLEIPDDRSKRFLGKVEEDTARCRGGEKAAQYRDRPWVDWQNYYATGDGRSLKEGREAKTKLGDHLFPNGRGIDGALLDLEYQRIELIKFNLFDPNTYDNYLAGRDGLPGATLKQWDEMRLPADHEHYTAVGGADEQVCRGDLITHRTLTGICNDLQNPLMGSSGMPFNRNMQFEATFPRLGLTELTRNRHAGRIDLLKPDPQLISRKLFTRTQSPGNGCKDGMGSPDFSADVDCEYMKAPFFNVLAAFWIQFMTHDWFSHTAEGRNTPGLEPVGCTSDQAQTLGCRAGDRREPSLFQASGEPQTFDHGGERHAKRPLKTTGNLVTAWWDASQIYGHDTPSQKRVQRDPNDSAKLLAPNNYLPLLPTCASYSEDCPVQPQWRGQEATGFPDNWNIGMSFYHNLFAREHNYFVDRFRELQQRTPDEDSGLRDPNDPERVIAYKDVGDERLFQVARLVVSAEIAKIHTIEWTTQLLYDEPLHAAMNANWFGLFNQKESRVSQILRRIVSENEGLLSRKTDSLAGLLADSENAKKANSAYSVLASGAGIFGIGNSKPSGILWWKHDAWDIDDLLGDVNGGINHFGSPFNFPEEFTSVYRLHALVPDLIEFRDKADPNAIQAKIPVAKTVRGGATEFMQGRGIDNWALSMGRQRLGVLHLRNLPVFLQNLPMPHLDSPSKKLDIVALDIIRDRERGVPRFNEFRRQIGLKLLTSFDDFVDVRLDENDPWRKHQEETVQMLREVYGTHTCDKRKIISVVQRNADGSFIDDCLGHPDGTLVDNVEDIDNMVGWLAEYTRPHGFAISETQFHIFILNASRRLFSDRFFTSSYRPEFYSTLGYDWLQHNGPLAECPYPLSERIDGTNACLEPEQDNGHVAEVSPLKRVLLRNLPDLTQELLPVKNVFDPWARDRGEYYSLDWRPRPDAASDPAFAN
ncbi:peroxidase family protein [Thiosocius teredinicola]|uniref:peroxidase family protein n=1 Tax=Thiosocius teredinicola TaxID=1973002 RepID=UPI00099119F5